MLYWKEVLWLSCLCFQVSYCVLRIEEPKTWYPTQANKTEISTEIIGIKTDSHIRCRLAAVASSYPLYCLEENTCNVYDEEIVKDQIVSDEADRLNCFTLLKSIPRPWKAAKKCSRFIICHISFIFIFCSFNK